MQADLKRHLREIQDALNLLPGSVKDPIAFTDKLLLEFGDKLSAAVEIHNFDDPILVATCRRRLDSFTDMLLYHLYPRFCPFGGSREGGQTFVEFEEFPPSLDGKFKPTFPDIDIPETVNLDDLMEQSVK